jgi:hypothetical protein
MKRALLLLAVLLVPAVAAKAQEQVYQCVRPDGTVVCTVKDKSGDPSVTCNHDCADCNMVCGARLRLSGAGQEMTPVPPPPVQGRKPKPEAPGTAETPEFCGQRYQECLAGCRTNPLNKTQYDMNACTSSCEDWRTGCGRMDRSTGGY